MDKLADKLFSYFKTKAEEVTEEAENMIEGLL